MKKNLTPPVLEIKLRCVLSNDPQCKSIGLERTPFEYRNRSHLQLSVPLLIRFSPLFRGTLTKGSAIAHSAKQSPGRFKPVLMRNCVALLSFVTLIFFGPFTRKSSAESAPIRPQFSPYSLHFLDIHTGKRLDIIYRSRAGYDQNALVQLNSYLRDRRTGQVHPYDPRVFDLLHDLLVSLGRPQSEIDVICGYRTPWTNAYLHAHGHQVAVHSLHMQAMAIDIRIPGVSIAQLRDAAIALHRGGVGFYPENDFVHVDVGRVRRW